MKRLKLTHFATLFISFLLLLSSNKTKADVWKLIETNEDHILVSISNYTVCGIPFSGNLLGIHAYINTPTATPPGDHFFINIVSKPKEIFEIPYKGKKGSNQVFIETVVCLGHYGPTHIVELDFDAPDLQPVTNLTASTNQLGQVTLTWEKGSVYPDADVFYEVYYVKGNTLLQTVSGDTKNAVIKAGTSWLTEGKDVDFAVITKLKNTNRESPETRVTGRVFGYNLQATSEDDGVKLSWTNNPEYLNGYRITRDDESIHSNIDKYDTSISDKQGRPGIYYKYTITAKDRPEITAAVIARRKPDGMIKGYVKTKENIAVGGVTVFAERQNIPLGDSISETYHAVSSEVDGSFEIKHIYYGYNGADFKIYPHLDGHKFSPDTLLKNIDFQTNERSVNFTDTTSLIVSGKVTQDGCGVKDVSIVAEGSTMPYKTREDGSYDLVVPQPGIYTIIAQKQGHAFKESYKNLEVLNNSNGIDFTDTTLVYLSGSLTASCNTKIGTATLHFFRQGGCFDTVVSTNAEGFYEIFLPKSTYNAELIKFQSSDITVLPSENVETYFNELPVLNLDSISVNDSAIVNYIYRLPPTLSVEFVGNSTSCDQSTTILEQNKTYPVVFSVQEIFEGKKCAVGKGYIVIEQELTSDQLITDTIHFEGFIDTLHYLIGVPNITSPYLNRFNATAYVDRYESSVQEQILIVGHKPRKSTFETVSPSIPFLVLHDPPGDGSYSFFEKSTTFTSSLSMSGSVTSSAGINASVKTGVKLIKGQFVLSESKFNVQVSSKIGLSLAMNHEGSWDTETSFTKGYSTSGDEDIIGSDGDLYCGGAINILTAVTDVIEYNFSDPCGVKKYQTLAVEPQGFRTTFLYTESHIINHIIPTLEKNRDLSPLSEKLAYDKQISSWKQIVENNHKNIDNASLFLENISFNGGLEYTSTVEFSSTVSQTLSSTLTLSNSGAINAEFEESGSGASVGAEFGITFETGLKESTSLNSKFKTGFTLKDDDDGDYQTVNILADLAYGTPAFKMIAGATSCPWEIGTLPREGVQLRSDKYSISGVKKDEEAHFVLSLSNTSQSDEDNTYNLVYDHTSNPYGALISIGGSPVVGNINTPYTIPAGQTVNASITIRKSPFYSSYKNLRFVLKSGCDGSISDDVLLNVEFESDCGNISLQTDQIHPLVNAKSENNLHIKLADYDKEKLSSIYMQKSTLYGTWETFMILTSDDINESKTELNISFEPMQDGTYYIRAFGNCSSSTTESNLIEVFVDRNAPITTMVNPLNLGTLKKGDVVYALFDEDIETMDKSDINIYNKTQKAVIDFQYGVTYRKLILLPNWANVQSGDTVQISIKNIEDIYGNSTSLSTTKSLAMSSKTSDDSGPSWSFVIPDINAIITDPNIDSDGDAISDLEDNCKINYNPYQEDSDDDGEGDACDDDIDGDNVLNEVDNCIYTYNPEQEDHNNNGIGDACELGTTPLKGLTTNSFSIQTFPNPCSEVLNFVITSEKDVSGNFEMYDVNGRILSAPQSVHVTSGINNMSVNVNSLSSGLYIYKLRLGETVFVNKFIK